MMRIKVIIRVLVFFVLISASGSMMNAKNFIVVIDAGHGGHDPGAIGQYSQEKDINLKLALAVGKLIETNCRDVDVIYTRTTDVFIPLGRRAEIANQAKADLFISIHTNSLPTSKLYSGASTWTLGLARSEANLDVAKKENSVILFESDYKSKYEGFNPNSSESYIIFEFMQDKYMKESVHLASLIQSQFRASNRPDRGVHQAGFLVLKASAMPSVLVELGFISSPDEERYLNGEEGKETLSEDIFRAFMLYKRSNEIKLHNRSNTIVPPLKKYNAIDDTIVSNNDVSVSMKPVKKESISLNSVKKVVVNNVEQIDTTKIIFKLQLLATRQKLSVDDVLVKDISDLECVEENGYFKYYCSSSSNYDDVLSRKKDLNKRFNDSFVVAYKNGSKTNIIKAIAQFKKARRNIKE